MIKLNASALKRTHCDQAFAYTCVDGLISTGYVEELNFGIAVHKFVELLSRARHARPDDLFIEIAIDAYLAAQKMYSEVGGLEDRQLNAVCMAYEQIEDRLPAPYYHEKLFVEHYFEVHYKGILLCGTQDRITFDGEYIDLYDVKTSREYDEEKMLAAYENSTQMMFYPMAIHLAPEQFSSDPAFIAAAKAMRIRMHIVPAFVNTSQRYPTPRWRIGPPIHLTAKRMTEYIALVTSFIPSIVDIYSIGHGMKNGWVSEQCRKCDFARLCHEPDPEIAKIVRRESYITKPFDPKHL